MPAAGTSCAVPHLCGGCPGLGGFLRMMLVGGGALSPTLLLP